MHEMRASFIQGSLEVGHTAEKAEQVFDVMEKFAGYGFNRSHAYAYSALASSWPIQNALSIHLLSGHVKFCQQ